MTWNCENFLPWYSSSSTHLICRFGLKAILGRGFSFTWSSQTHTHTQRCKWKKTKKLNMHEMPRAHCPLVFHWSCRWCHAYNIWHELAKFRKWKHFCDSLKRLWLKRRCYIVCAMNLVNCIRISKAKNRSKYRFSLSYKIQINFMTIAFFELQSTRFSVSASSLYKKDHITWHLLLKT